MATTKTGTKKGSAKKKTRIQALNETKIIEAAVDIFSRYGFRGSTIDQIAERTGLSKPNILYYFPSKKAIYISVLENVLDSWLPLLEELDPEGDPETELSAYIDRKLRYSREHPEASRLFASEIMEGAPVLTPVLKTRLIEIVDNTAATIETWINQGKIADVDPRHLITVLWATTQHYADFGAQVRTIFGADLSNARFADATGEQLKTILFQGLIK